MSARQARRFQRRFDKDRPAAPVWSVWISIKAADSRHGPVAGDNLP